MGLKPAGLRGSLRQISTGAGAIPDSVVSLYEYEDDADTTTALDSQGSNDATINGASYTGTANVGSLAMAHDPSNTETTVSDNTVDLSAAGDTAGFAIAAWVYIRENANNKWMISHGPDDSTFLTIGYDNGNLRSFFQLSNSNDIISGPSFSLNTWYHVYAEVQGDGTHVFKVDENSEGSSSSGFDPSNVGAGNHITGNRSTNNSAYADVIVDDFSPCQDPLTNSELSTLVGRA